MKPDLLGMTEMQLRRWVQANPGRVNNKDNNGSPALFVAACSLKSVPLVAWLLDEKGADANIGVEAGITVLHLADSVS